MIKLPSMDVNSQLLCLFANSSAKTLNKLGQFIHKTLGISLKYYEIKIITVFLVIYNIYIYIYMYIYTYIYIYILYKCLCIS